MSWFNAFGRRIKSLTGPAHDNFDEDQIQDPKIETPLGAFGSLMISILVFPLQVLFLPMRFLGLFHQTGVQSDDYDDAHNLSSGAQFWRGLKSFGQTLLRLPYLIVTAPIRFFQGVVNSSTKEIIFIVPAIAMLGFLIYVGLQVIARPEAINNRYSKEVQAAMEKGDFAKAKTYFNRIMQDQELSQPQKLQWMVVLAETGEREKAEALLDELAPDDAVGFAPAHKIKALQIASQLKSSDNPMRLASLEKHLTKSHDESPMTQQAWAIYYKMVDKPDKAIEALAKAAQYDPTFFTAIAKYQGELNRSYDQQETLQIAEKQFREILDKQPLNSRTRVLLANSISQQRRYDEAQEVLVAGMAKQPDRLMRVATAEFFTMRHDLEQAGGNDTGKRIQYLFRALGAQPHHPPVYERLVKLAIEDEEDDESAVRIRDELNHLIAQDEPNPMAHFALSNILWQQGEREQATVHLELAHKIEPKFVIVLNNLAWVLAHQKKPDLERALELAEKAVKISPDDGRYRDTRGSIYLKLKRFKDAIADLELAVTDVEDKLAVRKKLATAYSEIGMNDQAEIQKKLVADAEENSIK
jgi:tetratricopeptide (TPR) repeat protein